MTPNGDQYSIGAEGLYFSTAQQASAPPPPKRARFDPSCPSYRSDALSCISTTQADHLSPFYSHRPPLGNRTSSQVGSVPYRSSQRALPQSGDLDGSNSQQGYFSSQLGQFDESGIHSSSFSTDDNSAMLLATSKVPLQSKDLASLGDVFSNFSLQGAKEVAYGMQPSSSRNSLLPLPASQSAQTCQIDGTCFVKSDASQFASTLQSSSESKIPCSQTNSEVVSSSEKQNLCHRFSNIIAEVQRLTSKSSSVTCVEGHEQTQCEVLGNTFNVGAELLQLLTNDETFISKLQDNANDANRLVLMHTLLKQIDKLEADLMIDRTSNSNSAVKSELSCHSSSFNTLKVDSGKSSFSNWFEFVDDLRRNRMHEMEMSDLIGSKNTSSINQMHAEARPKNVRSSLVGSTTATQLSDSEAEKQRCCHSSAVSAVPGGKVVNAQLQSTSQQSDLKRRNRRFVKLYDFQVYMRSQLKIQRALCVPSISQSILSGDEVKSSILPFFPPLLYLSSRDGRRVKLLGRLRTEAQMLLRSHDDRKRTRLDFVKEVLRHRIRFSEFHNRSLKVIKRLAVSASRHVLAREKKDIHGDLHYQKERLAALRARDEAQYIRLLRETKNQRLLDLIQQTENYMTKLGNLVQAHRNSEQRQEKKQMVPTSEPSKVEVSRDEDPSYNALIAAKKRYFELTHTIQEEVTEAPQCLKGGELREYQLKGLAWLVSLYNNNLNGILADAMGLGKTLQTVALLGYLYEVKRNKGPFLIVAPLSTLHSGWLHEFRKWLPDFIIVIYDGSKEVRKNLRAKYFGDSLAFNVLLTTDAFIMKDSSYLKKIVWEYLIVDEAHRLKNPKSKLVQVLTDKRSGRGFRIKRRLALTGTPLQNDLQEVWALLNFLMPNIFNSSETFRQWFNAPLTQSGSQHIVDITEEEQLLIIDRLHKVLRPFLLRREKKEVENEVPKKHEEVLWCPLSAVQQKLYQDVEKGEAGFGIPSNTAMQLRKVCNHPYLFCHKGPTGSEIPTDESIVRTCGKFWVLDDILAKLHATGHRVLIFSQMVKLLNILEIYLSLRGWTFLRLDGGTSSDDRTKRLSLFNSENSPYFVFALSTKAGGLGVNLQSADTVIIYDSDWNPQNDEQAQSRAHRIGQTKEVLILRLVTPDTVEEKILSAAGVKLDKDALVIKSGMFYDSQHDLEDERRNRVRAILSKKNQRQAATFYEHGAINRILARTENELKVFAKVDRRRRLLGFGDLLVQPVYPPCLIRLSKTDRDDVGHDWRIAYSQDCLWTCKLKEGTIDSTPELLAIKKKVINEAILTAIDEIKSSTTTSVPAGTATPFLTLPDPILHSTYLEIIKQPMCLNHIKSFAEHGNFSSIITLEKYLARICSNCRYYNGSDHHLFHQALRMMGALMLMVKELCCVGFAEAELAYGLKTQIDVDRIKKGLFQHIERDQTTPAILSSDEDEDANECPKSGFETQLDSQTTLGTRSKLSQCLGIVSEAEEDTEEELVSDIESQISLMTTETNQYDNQESINNLSDSHFVSDHESNNLYNDSLRSVTIRLASSKNIRR